MNDEWSLKGKCQDSDEHYYAMGESQQVILCGEYYEKEDIETLRTKLIERIIKAPPDNNEDTSINMIDVLNIIDKLFGVKE